MEFAGRLKKIRIKLIMIGICLIFLGGYSLIQEWKDQKKNTTKKVFDQYTDAFFKENISTNVQDIFRYPGTSHKTRVVYCRRFQFRI